MGSIISQPKTTVNIIAASVAAQNTDQRVLFIGQKLPTGSAPAETLIERLPNDRESLRALTGAGSIASDMLIKARDLNQVTRFDGIFVDDDGGAANAEADITFSGTATEDGVLTFTIGDESFALELAIENGDTATAVGSKLGALITGNANILVSATNAAGVVTLAAKNGGNLGNNIGLKYSGAVAGISVVTEAFSGGTGDPNLSTILDLIGSNRYQTIVWPYMTLQLDVVKDFLDARFNVDGDVQDGIAIGCVHDTAANLITTFETENSQSIIVFGDKFETTNLYHGGAVFDSPWAKSSAVAALRSRRLQDGASIADITISSNGALDSFGGPAIASKPYFNTPVDNMPIVDAARGFTQTEIEDLQAAGVSVMGNNKAGNSIVLGEVVTTYKTDNAGNEDPSFKFANYVDTASNVREYFSNNLETRFAQSRLTEGDLVQGRDIANAELIAAFMTGLYQDLSGPDFVLVQAGEEALQFFKASINITLDLSIGRATIQFTTPIVTQFREILATMQIAFSING